MSRPTERPRHLRHDSHGPSKRGPRSDQLGAVVGGKIKSKMVTDSTVSVQAASLPKRLKCRASKCRIVDCVAASLIYTWSQKNFSEHAKPFCISTRICRNALQGSLLKPFRAPTALLNSFPYHAIAASIPCCYSNLVVEGWPSDNGISMLQAPTPSGHGSPFQGNDPIQEMSCRT